MQKKFSGEGVPSLINKVKRVRATLGGRQLGRNVQLAARYTFPASWNVV